MYGYIQEARKVMDSQTRKASTVCNKWPWVNTNVIWFSGGQSSGSSQHHFHSAPIAMPPLTFLATDCWIVSNISSVSSSPAFRTSKSNTISLVSSVPLRLPTPQTNRVLEHRRRHTTPPDPPLSRYLFVLLIKAKCRNCWVSCSVLFSSGLMILVLPIYVMSMNKWIVKKTADDDLRGVFLWPHLRGVMPVCSEEVWHYTRMMFCLFVCFLFIYITLVIIEVSAACNLLYIISYVPPPTHLRPPTHLPPPTKGKLTVIWAPTPKYESSAANNF